MQKSDSKSDRQIFDVQVLFDGQKAVQKNYVIKVLGTDKVLVLTAENSGANQQFAFEFDEKNETFKIVPQHSHLYRTVKSDGTVCQDELGAEGFQSFELSEVK